MAKKYKVYDTESGRVVSLIERVADAVQLAAGATTSGSASVSVTSTTGLWPGMLLIGKGIVAGTKVLSVDTATTFTMDANASATGSPLIIIALSYIPYKADGTLEEKAVHLQHYRDLFNDSTPMVILDGTGGSAVSAGALDTPGVVLYPTPATTVFNPPDGGSAGNINVDGTAELSVSDDKAHTPPREQEQICSFVHFILDDGTLLPVLRMPSYDIVPVS